MSLVAGIDSSTQSCKVVVVDPDTGKTVRSAQVPHPEGTSIGPDAWWILMHRAIKRAGGLDDVAALSVAGQQHGMVALDAKGEVIRDALLWNDTRSAKAAADLTEELGGTEPWVKATGSAPVASLTVTKLRWLADAEPENASKIAAIALPHDWLTWMLTGGPPSGLSTLVTDRSDASGTGYFNSVTNTYDEELLGLALRRDDVSDIVLPRVLAPDERAGLARGGLIVGPGAGDNAAAALAMQMEPGDVAVSFGTSGVVSAVCSTPVLDPSGGINGFADATGNFLPLAVTLNSAQTLPVIADLLGIDLDELAELALAGEPGSGGMTLLPYYQGERTPNLPDATASLLGMTLAGLNRANFARAAVEGLLCLLGDAMQRFADHQVPISTVRIIGGAARSEAVQRLAPAIWGRDVLVPQPDEYVALGAARQAAWALNGGLPDWYLLDRGPTTVTAPATPEVLQNYRRRSSLFVTRSD